MYIDHALHANKKKIMKSWVRTQESMNKVTFQIPLYYLVCYNKDECEHTLTP